MIKGPSSASTAPPFISRGVGPFVADFEAARDRRRHRTDDTPVRVAAALRIGEGARLIADYATAAGLDGAMATGTDGLR